MSVYSKSTSVGGILNPSKQILGKQISVLHQQIRVPKHKFVSLQRKFEMIFVKLEINKSRGPNTNFWLMN